MLEYAMSQNKKEKPLLSRESSLKCKYLYLDNSSSTIALQEDR